MKKGNFIIIILVCILIPGVLATPQTLSIHGKLTDSAGSLLSGDYNMTFKIYNSVTGGNSLWTDANQTITVGSDGIYNFILKDINLTFAEQYYLGIAVDSDSEMTPRINLTSTPYTFRANVTDNLNSANNYEMQNLTADSADFSGGWLSDGVSIIGGGIYAQVGYFYNITSLNVTKQNLTIIEDLNVGGNLTLGQKITFAFEEIIDNIIDGWVRITGSLNVTGNLTVDTDTLFVDADNGKVGIGTATPTQKLHVNGSANITGNLSLGDGMISFNDSSKRYIYYNGSTWKDMSMGNVPAGAIMAFNSATCPVGWIPADGTGDTPDLRGIFVRGAGISGVLNMSNGTRFSATYGEYQNDSFQGHWHEFRVTSSLGNSASSATGYVAEYDLASHSQWRTAGNQDNLLVVRSPIADGTYGTPRTGAETRPASFGLIYCMKTTEDSVTSNTLFQESGGIISTANASHEVDVSIRSYETGWVFQGAYGDIHLGDTVGSNVNHNLNAPLRDLLVKVLFSPTGADSDSFEVSLISYTEAGDTIQYGATIYAVDNNNVKIQTGAHGIVYYADNGGVVAVSGDYYKIKVFKLG